MLRSAICAAGLLAAVAIVPSTARAECVPFSGSYTTNLAGCGDAILVGGAGATGSWSVTVTYLGSSAGFWHSLWAFNAAQYDVLVSSGYADNTGSFLFNKTDGPQASVGPLAWTGGSEIIFGLWVKETNQWLFSGDPGRNPTDLTQIELFGTAVKKDNRTSNLASPEDGSMLFGFEDTDFMNSCVMKGQPRQVKKKVRGQWVWVTEEPSSNDLKKSRKCDAAEGDRDFNDAVFRLSWEQDPFDPPQETVPEPATMTLLATGLAGMAAARRRRNRQ